LFAGFPTGMLCARARQSCRDDYRNNRQLSADVFTTLLFKHMA